MKYWLAGAMALTLPLTGCEADGDYGAVLGEVLGTMQTGGAQTGALSMSEIDAGLREALIVGTNLVAGQLGQKNGYFADSTIRIPLPGRLGEFQRNLQQIGLSGPLDDIELRMNRAAEAAIPQARDLVVGAVRSITIEDALQILNGGDTAATDFLRGRTENQLRDAFAPHVNSALSQSGAFTAIESFAGNNGMGGISNQLQADLSTHAVNYGLDGVFHYVALEEKKIRENPLARTSEILRRVFGSR